MRKCQFIVSLLICIGLVSFLSACDNNAEERSLNLGNGNVLIVSQSVFENVTSDRFSIENVEIQGDILRLTISAGGCSVSSWRANLIASDIIGRSEPPFRGVKLSFEQNRELCQAVLTKEFTFNIKNLRVEGSNSVRLNISGIEIIYRY